MSTEGEQTHFEALGGEARLRPIIDDFVARIVADPMIGFFFARIDHGRLARMEYEHAAEALGAPLVYSGRPIEAAHAAHRIFGGQFARRREILRQVLEQHAVPDRVRDAWLAHVDSLRPLVTKDGGSECAH